MMVPFDGEATGAVNMALDMELLEKAQADGCWHMRTYMWKPWCVSLGKHQSVDVLDHDAMRDRGFDVVHRPTGGRAVLHADELTYCVAIPLTPTMTAQDLYAEVHRLLVSALRSLHIPELSYQDVPTDLRMHYASSGVSGASCFTSSARSEIMARGRKVVGSAQRVLHGIVLQHGSILCGSGHEMLAEVVRANDEEKAALRERIADGAITLSDIAGRQIKPQDCAEALTATAAAWPTIPTTDI